MWITHARALAAKELLEVVRSGWKFALQIVAMAGFMNWFVIRSYLVAIGTDPVAIRVAAGLSIVFVAMFVIPFLANGLLTRSLVEERQRQSLLALLATGVQPQLVWIVKLAVAFALSYVVMLVSILLHVLVTILWWEVTPVLTIQIVFGALLVSPLLAMSVIAFMAFLFWYFRNPHLVATVVPVVTSMAIWSYAQRTPGADILRYAAVASFVLPILIIGLGAFLIGRMPKQRIVGF